MDIRSAEIDKKCTLNPSAAFIAAGSGQQSAVNSRQSPVNLSIRSFVRFFSAERNLYPFACSDCPDFSCQGSICGAPHMSTGYPGMPALPEEQRDVVRQVQVSVFN